jgi:hypothetical protein
MKLWFSLVALSCLLGCCASAGLADNGWPIEGVPTTRARVKLPPPHFIVPPEPVAVADTQSFYTPLPVSEYRHSAQSPYVIEYGSARASRPVSAQPPTIRPSASPAHIQEFSTLPPELAAPSFEGGPSNAAPKRLKYRHVQHSASANASHPPSIAYKLPNRSVERSPLIPVHIIPDDEQVAGGAAATR